MTEGGSALGDVRAQSLGAIALDGGHLLINDFDGTIEDVADTAFRHDEFRFRRIFFDFPAKPQNLNVDRSVVDFIVVDAARLQQLIAGKNPLGSGQQCSEQVELAVGQCNVSAVTRLEASCAQVEFELSESVGSDLPARRGSVRRCT